MFRFPAGAPLALYCAAGHAADYLLLEQDVAEYRRDYRDDNRRVHGDVVGRELVCEVAYADLNRAQLLRRDDEVCKHELIPAGQELERSSGDDARAGQWQDNMPEARKEAAAIDIRRLLKLHRDGVHQSADEKGGHRDADGGIQEYHAAVCIIQPELVDDDKIRHHQSVERDEYTGREQPVELLAPPEAEAGDAVGAHAGDDDVECRCT